jgi:hypothetical protein
VDLGCRKGYFQLEVDHLDVLEVDLYSKDDLGVVLYSVVEHHLDLLVLLDLLDHLEEVLFILLEGLVVVLYNRDGLVEGLFDHLVDLDLVLRLSELHFALSSLVHLPSKLLPAPRLQPYWMKCYYNV